MANYEELINKAKKEHIPQVSQGLWYRIDETMLRKEEAIHIPAPIKAHPFLSSSIALATAALLLFLSIGLYKDVQLDNYLSSQAENLNSSESFFNYLETF